MARYALSGEADADIETIAEGSLQKWGLVRSEEYILELHQTFKRLAEFPDLGRDASEVRPGYQTIEAASHCVFYRKTENGVLIVRVLHHRMDFRRHL